MKLAVAPVFALAVLFASVGVSNAQSSRSCSEELGIRTSAELLIRCLNELSFRLEKAEDQARRLESRMFSLLDRQEVATVPSGAVMAFDLTGGCPIGWRQYRSLSGRVIVGTGRSGNTDTKDDFLTERELYDRGGQETVTLNIREMPEHSHPILRTDSQSGDGNFVNWSSMGSPNNKSTGEGTALTGSGTPHENMPPFLALNYCIKD